MEHEIDDEINNSLMRTNLGKYLLLNGTRGRKADTFFYFFLTSSFPE